MSVLDLFAGPGGFDEGLRALGITDVLGIEFDELAATTARLNGHERLVADVSGLDPADFAGITGLVASPPCQPFSSSGKGGGIRDREAVLRAVDGSWDGTWHDPRSSLVLEPLRWTRVLMPRWVVLEEVRAVLPIWEHYAPVMRHLGYHVATGLVRAEEHLVAQTRVRAVLVASLDHPVSIPSAETARLSIRDVLPEIDPTWVLQGNQRPMGSAGGYQTRRLDQQSMTVTGGCALYRWLDAEGNKTRMLTMSEAARLQGFRPDYQWAPVRKELIGKQVGNAVPPPLAAAVLGVVAR